MLHKYENIENEICSSIQSIKSQYLEKTYDNNINKLSIINIFILRNDKNMRI